MFSRLTVFIFVLAVGPSTWAKKEMILFGGGGEPEGSTTIFDQTVTALPLHDSEKGWDVQTYFDGGHAQSDAEARRVTGGKNRPMTSANMDAAIEDLKKRILAGDLKAGDQLMITLATHGARAEPGQQTHSISTIDGSFDLDKLKEVRDLAEAKGVSLAIMDMSCHSGATLSLGSDKTCVITAADEDVGYNNTAVGNILSMKPPRNLEDVYLWGRGEYNLGRPQISTEAGRLAYEDIRAASEAMSRRDYLARKTSAKTQICALGSSRGVFELAGQLGEIENVTTESYLKPYEDALKNYDKARRDAEALPPGPIANSFTETTKKIEEAAREVMRQERLVYASRYQFHTEQSKKPNPCKDFKL